MTTASRSQNPSTAAQHGYSELRPPPAFNMARYCIGNAARATPEKIALRVVADAAATSAAEIWTFRDIEHAALAIASALRARGLKRGDRLLIRFDNTSTYALLFFGAVAAGLVPIPASTQLTEAEAAFLLADSGAAAIALAAHLPNSAASAAEIIRPSDIAAIVAAGPPPDASYIDTAADDPAYMIYTSGTTSQPKGVVHAHRAAWGRRPMYQGWYGITPDDSVLHAGAFNWTYTLGVGLTDPWANGATAIVYTGPRDAGVWPRLIAAHGATIFAAVPSLYRQILKYGVVTPAHFGALRHGLMAGEAPPPELFDQWHRATGRHLHEAFGMSELSTYISCAPSIQRKAGFIGPAQTGRAVAILPVDGDCTPLPEGKEGLIAIHRSDPGLMLGYWNRPVEEREVTRGDWFVGGDIGVMDADGYIAHRGRANDIMKAMGYRVAPQEVEAVISACPGVAEVACTEVQVRTDVSIIGAFVVRQPDQRLSADAVMAHAAAHLAAYKCPRAVYFVDALPRTANGKLRRRALADFI